MKLVAHRGIHDLAPENTLPAFERAAEFGADIIEFDVRLSADRVPVVFHDSSLGRITSGSGRVGRRTLKELKEVRFKGYEGGKEGIPAFLELLEAFAGRIGMQIELKGPDPETSTLAGEVLRGFRSAWDSMEIISFEPALLSAFQTSNPGLKIGLLVPPCGFWIRPETVVSRALRQAARVNAQALHLHASLLSGKAVAATHSRGLEVHAWDVNDAPTCRKAFEWGAASICTDELASMAECIRASAGGKTLP